MHSTIGRGLDSKLRVKEVGRETERKKKKHQKLYCHLELIQDDNIEENFGTLGYTKIY